MNTNSKYIRHRYMLYPPSGLAYETSSMAKAAELLGFNRKSMYRVASGEVKQCFGWTAEILD